MHKLTAFVLKQFVTSDFEILDLILQWLGHKIKTAYNLQQY
jgi:hypothetical protein